jgi:thioredoxin reductase (NADPH)
VFLSEHAKEVYTLVRKPFMRAEPITVSQMEDSSKIKIKYNTEAAEFFGDTILKGIKFKSGRTIKVDAVFIEVGHIPLSEMVKPLGVKRNDHKYILVDNHQRTNLKGFCAAGDITTRHTLKQFITSAAEGSVAAETVYNYLKKNKW